jgi:uncharacterized protein involved in propanediol utilization
VHEKEVRNVYITEVGKSKRRNHFGNLDVDGTAIKNRGVVVLPVSGLCPVAGCQHSNDPADCRKGRNMLASLARILSTLLHNVMQCCIPRSKAYSSCTSEIVCLLRYFVCYLMTLSIAKVSVIDERMGM